MTAARILAQAEARLDLKQRFRIARARAQRLIARTEAHTDWMNECVPTLMGYGKDQDVAIAACLNMWRDAWEEAHPDGADDPGPSPPEAKQLLIARERLRAWDESQHPRVPAGSPDGGQFGEGGGGAAPAAPATAKGKKKATKEDFDKAKIKIPEAQASFLDLWNDKIGEDPATFKAEFMGGLNGDMTISLPSGTSAIKISGRITDASDKEVGTFDRNIDLGRKTAKSAYFSLNSGSRGNDIGKKLLAGNIETYQRLGIEKVGVYANIDVGGYAWAKYGYVPDRSAWNSLRGELARKVTGTSSSGARQTAVGYYTPESWEEISEDNQSDIRDAWKRDGRDDYVESERQNYWDSGQALEDTKRSMVNNFDGTQEWATDALDKLRETSDDIPYTNKQIIAALTIEEYESRSGEGRDDPEFSFNDDLLREPSDAPSPDQMNLPGFQPVDLASHLTDDMRSDIISALTKSFNDKADRDYPDAEVPDYIFDSADEYLDEAWDQLEDRDRYDYAERRRLIDDTLIESSGDEEQEDSEPVDVPEAEQNPLLDALHDPDPKAIWRVADLPQGKKLLLGTSWDGALDLKDPETMARFNSYVGKASHV